MMGCGIFNPLNKIYNFINDGVRTVKKIKDAKPITKLLNTPILGTAI